MSNELLPEGYYDATITNAELHEVNDKECLTITYDIEGKTLFYDGYFTPKAEEYTMDAFLNADAEKKTGGDLDKLAELVGQTNNVSVRHKTYEGKTSAIVRFINGTERKRKSVSEGRKAALSARLMAKAAAAGNAGGEEVGFSA